MADAAYPLMDVTFAGPEGTRTKVGPVECLGFILSGERQSKIFLFRNCVGQVRMLSCDQLFCRPDLVALFGGNVSWLKEHFPKQVTAHKRLDDGTEAVVQIVADFVIGDVATILIKGCYMQHNINGVASDGQYSAEKTTITTNDSENARSEHASVLKILFYAFMLAAGAFVLGLRTGKAA